DPGLGRSLWVALQRHKEYSSVLDGRFKGGHITRSFGAPSRGVHAVQMEMVEENYMDETCPYPFNAGRASRVRPILREQLRIATDFAVKKAAKAL
ncbi:MAG TPA: N-formylglutamate amidohydrolase, partial [Usitatibacter sp.]|nr:N-formylglutamate amidohydrolase [Usitatibacter sp.]